MPSRPVVIFMTSNGVGMGHLSRQLTTILSSGNKIRPVLFSLSAALPRIMEADRNGEIPELQSDELLYEYCPSRESMWLPKTGWRRKVRTRYRSYRWHPYLRDRLVALAQEVQASAVVFDGVVPYSGLLEAREKLPKLRFIWVRRGMWQQGVPEKRLDLSQHFDLTLEPGDYAEEFDNGPTNSRRDAFRVGPISLTSVLKSTSKTAARRELGLPADGKLILLAPGSGALGSVDAMIAAVNDIVREHHPGWEIVITRQSIAKHDALTTENVHVLNDVYPLARHLHAFDVAISAAGYNAVHELLSMRVPTLLIPSTKHVTDDQLARASGLASKGLALSSTGNLTEEIERLLRATVQQELRENCAGLPRAAGGFEVADHVYSQALAGTPDTNLHSFSSPSRPLIDARTSVDRGDIKEVRITESIATRLMQQEHATEHVVQGASTLYIARRHQIADWIYERAVR